MARLFQEDLRACPFWMLVGCQLVNRATWAKARGVLADVRTLWRDPEDLAVADPVALRTLVQPLGFHVGRAKNLRAFAKEWCACGPPRSRDDVLAMPGCGPYAADSWAIFVEGRRDVAPTDARLVWYLTDGREGRSG